MQAKSEGILDLRIQSSCDGLVVSVLEAQKPRVRGRPRSASFRFERGGGFGREDRQRRVLASNSSN